MPPGVGYNQSGVPLSPPGALSQRTDMQPQGAMQIPDAAYGEQQEFQEIQGGAAMAGPAAPPPIAMGAPTNRPDEPVTQGADFGMGAGSEVLPTDQTMQQDMKMIGKYLPVFENMSSDENIPESFRLFVRYLRSSQ